jgi:hypothetical protein
MGRNVSVPSQDKALVFCGRDAVDFIRTDRDWVFFRIEIERLLVYNEEVLF